MTQPKQNNLTTRKEGLNMSQIYYAKIGNEFFDVYVSFKALCKAEADFIAVKKYGAKRAVCKLPEGAILGSL
jgi:hypothetical protein